MEHQRICKICNRWFANGKAMGGHMRSHLAKLPLPPKPILQQADRYPSPLKSSSPSSSSSLDYPCSENPMRSYRSVNHDLPFKSSKSDDHLSAVPVATTAPNNNGESQTDSPRRRLKRRRKSVEKVAESSPELVSSISDIFEDEEDVALCLLMLSKDKQKRITQVYEHMEEDFNDEDDPFGVISARSKQRYKCETCKKVFRSYQALGGHKANHKKIKIHGKEDDEKHSVDRRMFKCPFCDKVFDSGQALGGHKKVHFAYLGSACKKSRNNLLDLNVSAHDDDGDEVSQAEASTISNSKAYAVRN